MPQDSPPSAALEVTSTFTYDHPPMKPRTYVETSVISYLAARPSNDLVTAAHQKTTHEWWQRRDRFDLFISELVRIEAAAGDVSAAAARSRFLEGIPLAPMSDHARAFARELVAQRVVPSGSEADAAHIAVATMNSMQFLVTWNCKHIANAFAIARIAELCKADGLMPPTICTPDQFAETEHVEPQAPTDA